MTNPLLTSCPVCDSPLEEFSTNRSFRVAGRRVVVREDLHRCTKCGLEVMAPGAMDAALVRAHNQVREAERLLAPAEIIEIRLSLGLSRPRFERLLRAGKKTVHRWENGTVFQSKTADELMRAVRDVPGFAERLAHRNGVVLKRRRTVQAISARLFDSTPDYSVRLADAQPADTEGAVAGVDLLERLKAQQISAANNALALAS